MYLPFWLPFMLLSWQPFRGDFRPVAHFSAPFFAFPGHALLLRFTILFGVFIFCVFEKIKEII